RLVKVGYYLERRARALMFERELRLKDGRLLAKATKVVEPLDGERYVVQVSVRNFSKSPLSGVELVDLVPKGHIVNPEGGEATESQEGTRLTWRIPLLGEGETFEVAYWAVGIHVHHSQPPRVKLEGYEVVRAEGPAIIRYRGTLEGGKKEELKKKLAGGPN
ncbi:MAG: hypothetical protein KIH01_07460, partial [Candidatus Freyarchaeota archaeon]|nr:hypothetical protein [Candidatus Jordarchaeia archaeon]